MFSECLFQISIWLHYWDVILSSPYMYISIKLCIQNIYICIYLLFTMWSDMKFFLSNKNLMHCSLFFRRCMICSTSHFTSTAACWSNEYYWKVNYEKVPNLYSFPSLKPFPTEKGLKGLLTNFEYTTFFSCPNKRNSFYERSISIKQLWLEIFEKIGCSKSVRLLSYILHGLTLSMHFS